MSRICCLPQSNPIYFRTTYTWRPLIVLESKAKALAIAQASLEKKATDVLVLHVAKLTSVADYLVLCSGESERQVRAIADHVDRTLSDQHVPPLSVEGTSSSQWVLMDFGDVVTHVFRSDVREHYALEKLWGDAKRVRLPTAKPRPDKPALRSPKKPRSLKTGEQG